MFADDTTKSSAGNEKPKKAKCDYEGMRVETLPPLKYMKMTLKSQVEKVKKVSRTDNRHSFWRGMSPFRICQRVGATTLMCDKRAHNKMHELGKAKQKELEERENF